MATERESQLAEFVKFDKIGASVAGIVARSGVGGKYDTAFIIFEPAIFRETRKGPFVRYGSLAVNISADLTGKVFPNNDQGKVLSITFNDRESTAKGNTKRVFRVLELTKSEWAKAFNAAEALDRMANGAGKKGKQNKKDDDDDDDSERSHAPHNDDDDDDELPF